jgi:type III restriction enzyme
VSVFNQDAWSGRIKQFVNEILEIERRLSSTVNPASPHNFELQNLNYTRIEGTSQFAKSGEPLPRRVHALLGQR